MMTEKQQQAAAAAFATEWEDVGARRARGGNV